MSNHLAVATVTAALQRLLQDAVGQDVGGVRVTTERPRSDNRPGNPQVNVCLYQVTPNAALRNVDLPTRNGNGDLRHRPGAALDLHYLLSFYGDEARLEPQRLLGSAVRALHSQPLLGRQLLRDVAQDASLPLAGSDVAEAAERVRLTPAPLSLEELSKLWSVMLQVPYTLSVAYLASVVVLEPDVTPSAALPVRQEKVTVVPLQRPTIGRVQSAEGARAPIVAGDTLEVHGRDLRGAVTSLLVGSHEIDELETVSDRKLTVKLEAPAVPDEVLRAGIHTVQVVHKIKMGADPPRDHRGFESPAAAFLLSPKITVPASASTELTITVEPAVGKSQRALVLLTERAAQHPRSYTLVAPPREEDSTTLTVPLAGVEPGNYLVQLQVDGATSALIGDDAGFSGPEVTVS